MNIYKKDINDLAADNFNPIKAGYEFDRLPNIPALLVPADIAHICSVSLQTIERCVADGSLPTIGTPDGAQILKSIFLEWLDSNVLANAPVLTIPD